MDMPPYHNKVHIYVRQPDYDFGEMEVSYNASLWITLHDEGSVGVNATANTAKLAHSMILSELVKERESLKKKISEYEKALVVWRANVELIEAWQEQDDGKYTVSP